MKKRSVFVRRTRALNAIGKSLSVFVAQSLNVYLLLENFVTTLSKKVFLAVLVVMPIIFVSNIGTFSMIANIVKRLSFFLFF